MGKVVLSLLQKPAFFSAAKNLGEPDSHFGRYTALAVDEFGKRVAGHPEGFGSVRNRQPHRLNALLQYDKAGVRRFFHGHGPVLLSGNRHNQRPPLRRQNEKSLASSRDRKRVV